MRASSHLNAIATACRPINRSSLLIMYSSCDVHTLTLCTLDICVNHVPPYPPGHEHRGDDVSQGFDKQYTRTSSGRPICNW